MLVDLHTHTNRYSPCSFVGPHDLVLRAKEIGLDGLAITEHDHLWSLAELQTLKEETGVGNFVLLRGMETERDGKHLLIFNYPYQIGRWPPLPEMIDEISCRGGVVILAHPFRHGRFTHLSLDSLRTLFTLFHGVEILTPQHSDHENKKALFVQQNLHIVGTGGSDSHEIDHVGMFVTYFPTTIGNEQDLAQAIGEGKCRPSFGRDAL